MQTLEDIIRDEIAREGQITFARYMALALYHPTLGYYGGGGAGREPLGWSGDYFTSGDVSPLWGWAIARQLRQMWELLGCPPRFDVIEPGAGRGLLAREVWRFAKYAAPEWGEALRYTLVDQAAQADRPASSLFEARRERLAAELVRLGVPVGRVRWVGSLAEAPGDLNAEGAEVTPRTQREETQRTQRSAAFRKGDLRKGGQGADKDQGDAGEEQVSSDSRSRPLRPLASSASQSPSSSASSASASAPSALKSGSAVIGVIVSNELLDALPVHIVEVVQDQGGSPALAEVYVALDASGRLVERLDAPSSPEVAAYLDRFGVPWRTYGAGWRAEIGLAAEAWIHEAAGLLEHGFILSIDYGAAARRLYTRDRRRGTLAVYARHQFGDRPLVAPGQRDITAHVNFSALAQAGREQGLRVAGYTTQAAFLGSLGVREAAEALGKQLYPAADTERQTERGQADLLRRRMLESAAATLFDPHGLGSFSVLIQQRGVLQARHALLGLL